ncbi:MAG: protein kinase [Anaerolineae bacterium]|nr:protein kinase [Anaerolineae bacterium]
MDTFEPLVIFGFAAILSALVVVLWRRNNTRRESLLSGEAAVEIVCVRGPLEGLRIPFKKAAITIGRKHDNDIVIDSPLVSGHHASIMNTPTGIMLKDLESTNGTWIRGQRIDQKTLAHQLEFIVGPCVFVLVPLGTSSDSIVAYDKIVPAEPAVQIPRTALHALDLGNYKRLKLLGEGGAATVYLCRSVQTQELLAIKMLHHSADPYFKQKFAHEGQIGQKLEHPNIVRTYGFGQAGSIYFIIMEYMAGDNLRPRLRGRPLPLEEAVQIVGQVGLALEYAHRNGVFHRDIKPENILFDTQGIAKLADFGIARFTSLRTVTQHGMLIGTPDYMSYEQAKGSEIDGRSDQYSLAIVLYEMLTGTRPFRGEPLTIVGQHLSLDPKPPREINSSIPRNVDRAIMKSLDKQKQKRYPNMLKFVDAIGYCPQGTVQQTASRLSKEFKLHKKPQARLVNLHTQQAIRLDGKEMVLGRNLLGNPQVSRRHARIWFNGGLYYIQDTGSRNGTFVNGIRVTGSAQLQHGSYVYFGPEQFQFLAS